MISVLNEWMFTTAVAIAPGGPKDLPVVLGTHKQAKHNILPQWFSMQMSTIQSATGHPDNLLEFLKSQKGAIECFSCLICHRLLIKGGGKASINLHKENEEITELLRPSTSLKVSTLY